MIRNIDNYIQFFHKRRIILFASMFSIVFVSLYALFFCGLSFDGAFHSQAALNLYKSGKYLLDYPIGFTQIKVPFQIVNGFFLTLFGTNFIAANLANILFYILLACFFIRLYKQFKSEYILLGLILVSFSPGVLLYGFQGYGEIPGLVFGLWGIFLVSQKNLSPLMTFSGAFLIGTAIATKWIFVLILIPFGLIILYLINKKKYGLLALLILGFLTSIVLFWGIEYANYAVNFKLLIADIFNHSKPVNNNYYSSYYERIEIFWNVYVSNSGNLFIAVFKIVAYFQLLFLSALLCVNFIRKITHNKLISSNQLFILLISLFALIYFVWWFFISSKPWYRRGFNADILLIISLTLSVKEIFIKRPYRYVFRSLLVFVVAVICVFNVFVFFKHESKTLSDIGPKGSIFLESQLRSGLNILPDDFIGCCYGWYQSPKWSFLSGVKHKNLESLTLEDKYEIRNGSDKYFLFIEPENSLQPELYENVKKRFVLNDIFTYGGYCIQGIEGLRGEESSIVESFVDYSLSDYCWTEGVYSLEKGFCWYSQNAKILLNSMNKAEFVLCCYFPDLNKYSSIPVLSVYFKGDLICKEQINQSGTLIKKIKVDKKYNSKLLSVNIQVSSCLVAKSDHRNLGVVVGQIGFK